METSSDHNYKETAVMVKNAYKRYVRRNVVLNGFNMNVLEGTIYGLLGPSGCGKTTLLNCILGRSRLDSGEIKVKVKTLSKVGYMPQEIALYKELNIIEIMTFYGRVFGLDDDTIDERTDELIKFLELPSKFRFIGGLSGGQQRRVSFAVVLLHDPQLLILDEPTVGVDPLLCVNIWNKLLQMVENENKTVIVTTHYIEETRQAHTIGFTRNGKILAEGSPSELMIRFNCSTLEDVFLHLCRKQFTNLADEQLDYKSLASYPTPKEKPAAPLRPNYKCSRKIVFGLLTKNFYWVKSNVLIMFLVLILPIINCLLFSACIGNDPNELKVAVVNDELPDISKCEQIPSEGCNFSVPLSCRYLRKLQHNIYKLTEYDNIDAAKNAVRKNKVWGTMYFPKNYTESMNERIRRQKKASNVSILNSEVQIWLDMSNQYIGNLLKKDVLKECVAFLRELLSDCGWSPRVADTPIHIEKAIYGNNNAKFRHSISSAILASFQFYLPMQFTLETVLMERNTGSLDRSVISGITLIEIAVSLMLIQFIVLAIQSTLMMFVLFVLYDNPILVKNLIWIITLLFLTGSSGMSYGFLLGAISSTEQSAIFAGIGSSFAIFLLCGVMWPVDGMHWTLRSFSKMLPITQSAEAFQALSVKDWPITNSTVYEGFYSNFGWICGFILVTSIIVTKNKGIGTK